MDSDRGHAGVLHVEPEGPELRRLDARAALAVLADPVLAGRVAGRGRTRPAEPFLAVVDALGLLVSAFSVGYAIRFPWSHPWGLDLMEHLNLYELKR